MIVSGCFRFLVLLGLMTAVAPARAESGFPPDIVILAEPTLRPLLLDLDRVWRRRGTGALRIFTTTTDGALKQAGYGARADVIFGAGAEAARDAVANGVIKTADLIGSWQDPLVLASYQSAGGGTDDKPLREVIGAAPVATIDGTLSADGLETLGLGEAPLARHVSTYGSEDALWLLAQAKVGYAVLFATDLQTDRHVTTARRALPLDIAPPRAIWAGESNNSRSSEMADFRAFLQQPAVQDMIAAHGLQRSAP